MTKHLLSHMKQNTIAYFALFVALGGTSYASVKIPQAIHAQQAAKSAKAGITCGGRCPATRVYWAYIGMGGGPARAPLPPVGGATAYQTAVGGVPARLIHQGVGDWLVFFQAEDLSNCARFVNLTHDRGSASAAGYDHFYPDKTAIHVLLTDANGQPADLDFVVLALCGNSKNLQVGPAAPGAGVGGQ